MNERSVTFNEMVGGREKVTTDERVTMIKMYVKIPLRSAPNNAISTQNLKNFLGRGSLPIPHSQWRGGYPLPISNPITRPPNYIFSIRALLVCKGLPGLTEPSILHGMVK